MKTFFQSFLGSCLGILTAVGIGIFLIIGLAISGSGKQKKEKHSGILKIQLNGSIPDYKDNTPQNINLLDYRPGTSLGFNTIVEAIRKAKNDDEIKGIVLDNSATSLGLAQMTTFIDELKKFKEKGKFIYAYGDFYTQSGYIASSVADSIFLNPQGMIDLRGFGTALLFFKDALNNLGVDVNLFYAGDYKSAGEPFVRNNMSEPNKEQLRAFIDDITQQMVGIIAENRKMQPEEIHSIMNAYAGRSADKAFEAKLVEQLTYRDEFNNLLRKRVNLSDDKNLNTISLESYAQTITKKPSLKSEKIAVVYLEGEIMYDSPERGLISEKRYLPIFEKIRSDKKVKAVVLRINSPGGSAFTSDVLWREIELLKAQGIKIVSSFGDYAASGGYYIAAGSDKIVAQPSSLTGSIGVFSLFLDASNLLENKLKLHVDTVKSHTHSLGLTPLIPLSPKEKELMQEATYDIYQTFLSRVSKGRNMDIQKTESVAQGRIWTGKQALELGLVDELGDLDKAIETAKSLAGITDYKLDEYPKFKENFMTELVREFQSTTDDEFSVALKPNAFEQKWLRTYREYRNIMQYNQPMMRMPFILKN